MTLTATLKGEGNAVCGFEINGKSATEPFMSGSLHGEQPFTLSESFPASSRTPAITSWWRLQGMRI
jgi:hypothetical protein